MANDRVLANDDGESSPGELQREWERYYGKWSERVFRYLLHMVGSREAAEDLFQETWMRALDRRHQLSTSDNFGPWVLRIARNLALNSVRTPSRIIYSSAMGRSAYDEDDGAQDFAEGRPSPAPGPRERAINAQRREIIQRAIGELDEATQEMLQLRYFEELTLAEIAETLQVPLGTVCTKVHRGLKSIRERLERQGFKQVSEM